VEAEIDRALDRKVPLKSGGCLMFDQNEAMTTIDVNTGAFVGHRNLGGIIIADFIDMEHADHRRGVLQSLEQALAGDPVRTRLPAGSALGLVEMTRKRTRDSLEHQLCQPCPNCDSRGFGKTAETVAYPIFREVLRQARQSDFQELVLLAHQDVIELLLDEESAAVADPQLTTGKPVRLQAGAQYAEEQLDVVPA
jgi:ribonuclease G